MEDARRTDWEGREGPRGGCGLQGSLPALPTRQGLSHGGHYCPPQTPVGQKSCIPQWPLPCPFLPLTLFRGYRLQSDAYRFQSHGARFPMAPLPPLYHLGVPRALGGSRCNPQGSALLCSFLRSWSWGSGGAGNLNAGPRCRRREVAGSTIAARPGQVPSTATVSHAATQGGF